MALMVVACGKKHDDNAVNPDAPVPPKSVINDDNNVDVNVAKLYGNMQFIMANQEEDEKNFTVMDILMGDVGGHFRLDKSEKKYWVKAIDDETLDDLYDGASFAFGKVDGHIVTICYDKDLMPMWTMVGFQSEEEYNEYRRECFLHALVGKYKYNSRDIVGNPVTISADGNVQGLFGCARGSFQFTFINTYVTDICKAELEDLGVQYFGFAVKDYGLDLLETEVDEETGERVVIDEVHQTLEVEDEQDLSWIHKHILTSDYYNYVSSSTRKRMIEMLKAVESPSQTEQWNLFILENFKDPEAQEIPDEE